MTAKTHPTDNLVRGLTARAVVAEKTDEAQPLILHGEFARFDEWTEIDSYFEGRFLEKIAPTAFDRTLKEDLHRVKVLYDHGHDPQLGNKPLGPIRSIAPGKTGMEFEVELIDTDYNRNFIVPAAGAGLLGASFRMGIQGESWFDPSEPSAHNPKMLPERTITEVKPLYEFGPVTFPAYEGAQVSMRSRSDEFMGWIINEPEFVARFAARANPHVLGKMLDEARALGYTGGAPTGHSSTNGQPTYTQTRGIHATLLEIERLREDI